MISNHITDVLDLSAIILFVIGFITKQEIFYLTAAVIMLTSFTARFILNDRLNEYIKDLRTWKK